MEELSWDILQYEILPKCHYGAIKMLMFTSSMMLKSCQQCKIKGCFSFYASKYDNLMSMDDEHPCKHTIQIYEIWASRGNLEKLKFSNYDPETDAGIRLSMAASNRGRINVLKWLKFDKKIHWNDIFYFTRKVVFIFSLSPYSLR